MMKTVNLSALPSGWLSGLTVASHPEQSARTQPSARNHRGLLHERSTAKPLDTGPSSSSCSPARSKPWRSPGDPSRGPRPVRMQGWLRIRALDCPLLPRARTTPGRARGPLAPRVPRPRLQPRVARAGVAAFPRRTLHPPYECAIEAHLGSHLAPNRQRPLDRRPVLAMTGPFDGCPRGRRRERHACGIASDLVG